MCIRDRVKELERSKKEVVRELEEKSNDLRKVEGEKEGLRAELSRAEEVIRGLKSELAAQAKMHEQHLQSSKANQIQARRINAHLWCNKGRIEEKKVTEEDLDSTEVSFADPERGIACHHISVVQDANGGIKVHARNTKRQGKICN